MPRLTWDDVAKRFFELGVQQGVIYPQSKTGTYPKGTAWDGLVSITENPSGAEPTKQYANNGNYITLMSTEEFSATLECFTYPNEFASCDGQASPAAGLKVGQQTRKPFGLAYKTLIGNDVDGIDHAYKIHLVYGVMSAPSSKSYGTIGATPEPSPLSYELSTTPVPVKGLKPSATIVLDSRDVEPLKLAAIEELIYGSEGEEGEARLPLPDEIIALLGENTQG